MKALRIRSGSQKPVDRATRSIVSPEDWTRSRATSTRRRSTAFVGVDPVSATKERTKCRELSPARSTSASTVREASRFSRIHDSRLPQRPFGVRAFGQRFYKLHNAMPTAPQAYSAVLQYLRAAAAVGTDDTNAVLEKIRSMPVDDFHAPGERLRADNKLVHDFHLVEVNKPADVKAPWDYYNVETIRAEDAHHPLSQSERPLLKTSQN
ncbi:hypothetical protein XH87_33290 [Bradyrhizobium sp. CCBAU 53415]|nr:hypothetical protein [Bradyrhizobium sp. CCBAU 53415]